MILRRELRGLLRGQVVQSPLVVGRALELIGADLGVMIRLAAIEVVEDDVKVDRHEAVIRRNQRPGSATRRSETEMLMDTVTYTTHRGRMSYYVEAEIILVDASGREVSRFSASSTQEGPFERGEFDGDPSRLNLQGDRARFFDPSVLSGQTASIEGAVLEELAVAIAVGTFDQVLAGIR